MNKSEAKEKRRHSTPLKPYSFYRSRIPEFFPNVPLHWHNEFEINLILEGSGAFVCGADRFTAAAGDIVIITPDMLHSVYPLNSGILIYDTLVFDSSMIGSHSNDRGTDECIRPLVSGEAELISHITSEHIYYGEIMTTAENIISAAKGDTPELDILMKSELLRLIWLLRKSGDVYSGDKRRSEFLLPILECINESYTESITIAELARAARMSESRFMAEFKRLTGISAMEYVIQLRLRYSMELLTGTDRKISDIAFECGFRNLSNFNKQFRLMCASSPKEYRKHHREHITEL